ncbi:MAG: globin-coupled sensor protein [Eubacteriales bacterium]|jgi:heme-based aerotactic transducer|nr:globin-coupled sensor protein [Eubacteriales bacterium]
MGLFSKKEIKEIRKPLVVDMHPGVPITVEDEKVQQKVNYIHLSDKQLQTINDLNLILESQIPEMVENFYADILKVDVLRNIIDKNSTVEKLKGTLTQYLRKMMLANVDTEYIKGRQKIGQVHDKIKLHPEWFMGAYHILRKHMIPVIIEAYRNNPEKLADALIAIDALTSFDNILMIEEYIKSYTSQMLEIEEVKEIQTQLQNDSQNLAAAAQQTTASANEMSSMMSAIRRESLSAADFAQQVKEYAENGGKQIQSVTGAMRDIEKDFDVMKENVTSLNESSESIAKIIDTISQIADQTNLLALNASIEAARAGEQGRGFAVVAEEVRKLAEGTDNALKDIAEKIQVSRQDTQGVFQGMERAGSSVNDGLEITIKTLEGFQQIITAVQSNLEITKKVADDVDFNASIANQIKEASENVAILAEGLASLAGELSR